MSESHKSMNMISKADQLQKQITFKHIHHPYARGSRVSCLIAKSDIPERTDGRSVWYAKPIIPAKFLFENCSVTYTKFIMFSLRQPVPPNSWSCDSKGLQRHRLEAGPSLSFCYALEWLTYKIGDSKWWVFLNIVFLVFQNQPTCWDFPQTTVSWVYRNWCNKTRNIQLAADLCIKTPW